jgi:hypothetical protein
MFDWFFCFREHHLKSILFDQSSGYNYLTNPSNEQACFWALRTLVNRCISSNNNNYLNEL